MNKDLSNLLSIASGPISPTPPVEEFSSLLKLYGQCGQELTDLLGHRNGFFAFESALLVRPLNFVGQPVGLLQWNSVSLWKNEYQADLSGVIFFAEDIFGVQFCIKNDLINSFDPETGELKAVATNLEEWLHWIQNDSRTATGWPLAHLWQERHGALKHGTRLLPKVPFVLGGQFSIENLYALDETEGMRFRANIANQLRNCPDGTKVVIKLKPGD